MYSRHSEWENGNNYYRNPPINYPVVSNEAGNVSNMTSSSTKDGAIEPPPIPQRQMTSSYQPSPYMSGYGGMGGGMYGNPYQSYMYGSPDMRGMYGSPMYGNAINPNTFESASQNAFQNAQTFIGAFTSVSMMLESTLFAVQNSVRAITSVADQFGNLRNHMLHTSAAFLRTIKYYLNRVLVSLRLRRAEGNEAKYWMEAMNGIDSQADSKRYASLLFFCVLVATPWFVWKFLRALTCEQSSDNSWIEGSGRHFVAEVKYSFTSRSKDELSVTANSIIRLAPKHLQPNIRGWLLASDGEKQGLVPANYVKILGKNRDHLNKKNGVNPSKTTTSPTTTTTTSLPVSDEKTLDEIFEEEIQGDKEQA